MDKFIKNREQQTQASEQPIEQQQTVDQHAQSLVVYRLT